eukprot:GEMP01032676.1.p1 GENE.GEMP01032676.1~~GEMP01032676.1.p1  ORF type:complete len:560 (+),score=95.83 GEMP01032676.1:213-1892(+)
MVVRLLVLLLWRTPTAQARIEIGSDISFSDDVNLEQYEYRYGTEYIKDKWITDTLEDTPSTAGDFASITACVHAQKFNDTPPGFPDALFVHGGRAYALRRPKDGKGIVDTVSDAIFDVYDMQNDLPPLLLQDIPIVNHLEDGNRDGDTPSIAVSRSTVDNITKSFADDNDAFARLFNQLEQRSYGKLFIMNFASIPFFKWHVSKTRIKPFSHTTERSRFFQQDLKLSAWNAFRRKMHSAVIDDMLRLPGIFSNVGIIRAEATQLKRSIYTGKLEQTAPSSVKWSIEPPTVCFLRADGSTELIQNDLDDLRETSRGGRVVGPKGRTIDYQVKGGFVKYFLPRLHFNPVKKMFGKSMYRQLLTDAEHIITSSGKDFDEKNIRFKVKYTLSEEADKALCTEFNDDKKKQKQCDAKRMNILYHPGKHMSLFDVNVTLTTSKEYTTGFRTGFYFFFNAQKNTFAKATLSSTFTITTHKERPQNLMRSVSDSAPDSKKHKMKQDTFLGRLVKGLRSFFGFGPGDKKHLKEQQTSKDAESRVPPTEETRISLIVKKKKTQTTIAGA